MRYFRWYVWLPLKRKISCDCYHAIISSRSCKKCGRGSIMTKEMVDRALIDFTWENYAVGRALYEFEPNQGEAPNPHLAHQWLRTTLRKDHPNYVDPKTLGYGERNA